MNRLLLFIFLFVPTILIAQKKEASIEILRNELKAEIKIADSVTEKKVLGQIYGRVGVIYLHIAKLSPDKKMADSLISADRKVNLNNCIAYLQKSIAASTEVGDMGQLKTSYKNLNTAQRMAGKLKDAMDSYAKLAALKKTIFGSKKANEIEKKHIVYESAKRMDSMHAALDKTITQTQKEKEKVSKALVETKNDLTVEKSLSEEKERQLIISEQKKQLLDAYIQVQQSNQKLMQNDLKMKNIAIAQQRKERYFYIFGVVALLVISALTFRSFYMQKRSNFALLREKKRSERLLRNILPAEVAEELKEKGVAEAKHFSDVTVLFTDFVGFTSVAESMTPQQLVGELHICFTAFDKILGKYHIEKIKTVGDAYLAASGLPLPNANHGADVVAAAIEIRDYMLKRKKEHGEKTFNIRIGVNSGEVVAGIVGVQKFSYDIWGDTVNVAARMEQNSEEGKINISSSTHQLVKDKYPCQHRGKIEAKNKGSIDMYYIMA